jgi:hypothetical protein
MVGFTHREAGMGIQRGRAEAAASVERRSEERHEGLVENATIWFRGAAHNVPVLNISSRGTMVESDIAPRLGETVLVEFPECSKIHAFVRWAREGRIGLNFGHEILIG